MKQDQICKVAAKRGREEAGVPACGWEDYLAILLSLRPALSLCTLMLPASWWDVLGKGGQLQSEDKSHREIKKFPFLFSMYFFLSLVNLADAF